MSDEAKSCSVRFGAEPAATRSSVPIWIVMLTLALLFLGAVYFDHHSGWFDANVYQPYASAAELEMFQPKSATGAALVRGKVVYEQVCGLCHGNDGLGKLGQAPPLAGSEWVNTKGFFGLTHIPLAGLNGPLKVEGKDWNLSMAPMGAALSDADLANVLTYIRGSWGNRAAPVSADDVKAIRAAIGGRPQPLNAEQLKVLAE